MRVTVKPARVRSGVVICLGMFALGGAMLLAFFKVPRGGIPAPAAEWGVPERRVRIVSCRLGTNPKERDRVAAEVRRIAPDYLLLQDAGADQVDSLAKQLQLNGGGSGPIFYPTAEQGNDSRGNAILATRPLYDGRSIPNPGGESFGVWASSIIDGRKFVIASVDLAGLAPTAIPASTREHEFGNLLRAWHALHDPPMIVAGDLGASADGSNARASSRRSPQPGQRDWFYLYGGWHFAADGVLAAGPEKLPPIWIDLQSENAK